MPDKENEEKPVAPPAEPIPARAIYPFADSDMPELVLRVSAKLQKEVKEFKADAGAMFKPNAEGVMVPGPANPQQKCSKWQTAKKILIAAVNAVEEVSAELLAVRSLKLSSEQKRKLAVDVINLLVNVPAIPEWLEGKIIGIIVDAVVEFANDAFGKAWRELRAE